MTTSIQIIPEQINEFIATSILQSSLGKEVEAAVQRVLKDIMSSYKNPYDGIIARYVGELIEKLLKEKYIEHITTILEKTLKEKLTDELIQRMVDAAVEKLNRY